MKFTDTIIDLNLNMLRLNTISKSAIYDHIVDIVFDLYQVFNNIQEEDISIETKGKLIDICKKTFDEKIDEYVEFVGNGLTDEIKKDEEKLDSFMENKVNALIPIIENHLIDNYNILYF